MAQAARYWRVEVQERGAIGSFQTWNVLLVPTSDVDARRLEGYERLLRAGGAKVTIFRGVQLAAPVRGNGLGLGQGGDEKAGAGA